VRSFARRRKRILQYCQTAEHRQDLPGWYHVHISAAATSSPLQCHPHLLLAAYAAISQYVDTSIMMTFVQLQLDGHAPIAEAICRTR
jgi:hypothetical protein